MTNYAINTGASEATAEETSAALAAAAAAAVTTEAEAKDKIEAEKKAPAERPKGLPEKFNSWEEMAQSYSELEKKLGAPKEETPPSDASEETNDDPSEGDEGDEPEVTEDDVEEVEKLDVGKYDSEYAEKGELSEDSYAELEARGFDRATVDAYIAGQEALAELANQRITAAAGGEDALKNLFAWASTSLTEAERLTYNKSFEGNDVEAAVIAMEKLKSKYEAVNGKDPKLLSGGTQVTAGDTFQSWAQVTEAMSDPRYGKDRAYVAQVQAKLSRSNPR